MKTTVHLYWKRERDFNGNDIGKFVVYDTPNMATVFPEQYTLVTSTEVEIDIGNFNQREVQIASLEAEKALLIKENAKQQKQVAEIEEKIQQLLAPDAPATAAA